MIKIFTIFFLLLATINLASQKLVLQGKIQDSESGQILPNVNIEVDEIK